MQVEKLVNRAVILLYLLGCVAISAVILATDGDRFGHSLLSPLFLLAPFIIERLFRLKRDFAVNISYYVYVFFAYCTGVTLRWYHTLMYYDKIMHFLSGIMFTIIGAHIYRLMLKTDAAAIKQSPVGARAMYLIFPVLFSMAGGYLWEIYEFVYSFVMNEDIQWVTLTGVSDTMWDMICALAGALLAAGRYAILSKK